jgi:hypothetical protein
VSTDDTIYMLASNYAQAYSLFGVYQTIGDEGAIQMVRSGMINSTEAEAYEHQARAGRGKVFAVTFEVTECSPAPTPTDQE